MPVEETAKSKWCWVCERRKLARFFHKNKQTSDGLQDKCALCTSEYQKRRRADPEIRKLLKEASRNRELKKRYGITSEEYQEMEEAQGGLCAICRRPPAEGKKLAVDHDHLTGLVRRLLCDRCNWLIGLAYESIEILESAKQYLLSFKK
jgi:hypothetical protein